MFSKQAVIYLVLTVGILSCRKNENPIDEPFACNSTNFVVQDSFPVIFTTLENGKLAIHQLLNGVETSLIADAQYDFWWPQFSPDKQQILCYRSPGGDATQLNDYSQAELWKFNADGTGGYQIIQLIDYGWNAMGYARWVPDGKHIVMAAANEDPADNNNVHWHLYVTDTAGNNMQKITNRSSYFESPDVSPDFQTIAYSAYVAPAKYGDIYATETHIATLDTATWTLSNEVRVTNNTRHEEHIRWSLGGVYVAFHSASSAGDYSIHTCLGNGTGLYDLPRDGKYMSDAAWATGNRMYFVLREGTHCLNHLAVMDYNGQNRTTYYRWLNKNYLQPDL